MRIRTANVVTALAGVGDVDYFTMYDEVQDRPDLDPTVVPAGVPIARAGAFPRPRSVWSPGRRLDWLVRGRLPAGVSNRDYRSVRGVLRSWARPPYDLVWYQLEETYLAVSPEVDAPAVVDLDVLIDDWSMRRLAVSMKDRSRLSPRALAAMNPEP